MKIIIGKNTVGKTHYLLEKYNSSRGNSLLIDHNGTCERSNIYVDFEELQYESDRRYRGEDTREIELIKSELHEFYKAAKKSHDKIRGTRNKSNGILKLERILEALIYQNLNNIVNIYIDEPDTYIDSENLIMLISLLNMLEHFGISIVIATHSSEFVSQCSIKITDIEIIRGNYLMGTKKHYSISDEKILEIYKEVNELFEKKHFENGNRCGMHSISLAFEKPEYIEYLIMCLSDQDVITALFYDNVLLFEGYSEKVINNLLFKYNKFSKITCGGKSLVILYAYILKSLGMNVSCVVDRDNEHNCAHFQMNKVLDEQFNTLFFESNLESEYNIPVLHSKEKPFNAFVFFSDFENMSHYKGKLNSLEGGGFNERM